MPRHPRLPLSLSPLSSVCQNVVSADSIVCKMARCGGVDVTSDIGRNFRHLSIVDSRSPPLDFEKLVSLPNTVDAKEQNFADAALL